MGCPQTRRIRLKSIRAWRNSDAAIDEGEAERGEDLVVTPVDESVPGNEGNSFSSYSGCSDRTAFNVFDRSRELNGCSRSKERMG